MLNRLHLYESTEVVLFYSVGTKLAMKPEALAFNCGLPLAN